MVKRRKLSGKNEESLEDRFCSTIANVIKKKYFDYQFTVRGLAEGAHICVSYLEERLHKGTGISPRELIETVRINEALKLIADDIERDFYEISGSVGYKNPKAMRLAFKRRLGLTPVSCRLSIVSGESLERMTDMLWSNMETWRSRCDGQSLNQPTKTSVSKFR